jgi:3,4-dihydroxy 2-butanone 4-phosphate synthase/GTP cyclohydrolase II
MPVAAEQDGSAKAANRAGRSRVGQLQEPFAPTEQVLHELRNGRMVVIVDAQDRENEGDLVIPAQMATPQAINFMATHGRGLICLAMPRARGEALRLNQMVRTNGSRHRTAFTQSIEAREGISTGISARDRAHTIATAITKGASDLVSPGHVFPLIARDGGVLVRAGHTEASVDLARLAGLMPAAVICEIMNADGTMARVPDLAIFAKSHGLKIGTIDGLISHRLRHECLIRQIAETKINSCYGGSFELKVFATTVEPGEHLALIKGDLSEPGPVLVRVHAVNPMSDFIGVGLEPGADPVIAKALKAIEREGRGVLVLISDAGREGISDWMELRSDQTSRAANGRLRLFETGVGSQILKELGVTDMALLTSAALDDAALHDYVGVEAFGLSIVERRPLD